MRTVFVSSTFRDMQYERDALHQLVLPTVNKSALAHGDNVSLCDLRWGIMTGNLDEEEGTRKILEVCFDRIDQCRPYMIILAGDRYGWVPDEETAERIRRRYPAAFSGRERTSVTEMEIQYGLLSQLAASDRVLVYFRRAEGNIPQAFKAEDAEHDRKQKALKARLMAALPGKVKEYRMRFDLFKKPRQEDIQAFAEQVRTDLEGLILRDLQSVEGLSGHAREKLYQETFCRIQAEKAARETWPDAPVLSITGNTPIYAISGRCGSGKTAMMAHLAIEARKAGCIVVPVFAGLTEGTNDTCGILRYMTEEMEDIMGYPHFSMWNMSMSIDRAEPDPARPLHAGDMEPGFDPGRYSPVALRAGSSDYEIKCWSARLEDLIMAWHEKETGMILFLLDAPERLRYDKFRNWLQFTIPKASPRAAMICFCSPQISFKGTRMEVYGCPDTSEADIRAQIRAVLKRKGRELAPEVIEAIVRKNPECLPLKTSFLLDRLEMMDRRDFEAVRHGRRGFDEKLTARQLKLIAAFPGDIRDQFLAILKAAAELSGSRHLLTFVSLMVSTPGGLRESDMEGIGRRYGISWDAMAFTTFTAYLQDYFLRKSDGRWDIASSDLKIGLKAYYRRDEGRKQHQLFEWFRDLPSADPVRVDTIVSHAVSDRAWAFLTSYVSGREERLQAGAFDRAVWSLCEVSIEDDGEGLLSFLRYLDQEKTGPYLDGLFSTLYHAKENGSAYVPDRPEIWAIFRNYSRKQLLLKPSDDSFSQYFDAARMAVRELLRLEKDDLKTPSLMLDQLGDDLEVFLNSCENEKDKVRLFIEYHLLRVDFFVAAGAAQEALAECLYIRQHQLSYQDRINARHKAVKADAPGSMQALVSIAMDTAETWRAMVKADSAAVRLLKNSSESELTELSVKLMEEALLYAEKLKGCLISDANTALYEETLELKKSMFGE